MSEITQKLETITPEQARIFLKSNSRNRKLKKSLVDQLVTDIKEGQFFLTHQGIAFDKQGHVIDGQHRLAAIVEAGKPVQIYITRGLDPEMMNVVDVGAKRTQADVLSIHGHENSVALASAASIYKNYLEGNFGKIVSKGGRYMNNFTLLDFVKKHPELQQAIKWTGSYKKIKQIGSLAITVAFYAICHQQNKTKASEFFRVLADNFSDKRNHPALILNEHILRRRANKMTITRVYLIAAFCRSWQNFLAGEFTANIVIKDASQVIRDFK